MRKKFLGLSLCGLMFAASANAVDVAGVHLPEQVYLPNHDAPLVLNGAGVLKRFFTDIYIGALYLQQREKQVSNIINQHKAKCITMYVLYDELDADTLHASMMTNIEDNLSEEEQENIAGEIEQVRTLLRDVKKGDVIAIDYLPEAGTRFWINQQLQGAIMGEKFYQAMLRIWLGDDPADWGLKLAMLGKRKLEKE